MTNRKTIYAPLMLVAALWCPLLSASEGYACAYRGDGAPVMDGRVDGDPFWSEVPRSAECRLLGKDRAPDPLKTWFKLAYTNDAVYFGICCEEPRMDKLKADAKPNGELWNDDSVEIFIAPPSQEPYLHLIVNAAGVRYNGQGLERIELLRWTAVCAKDANAYSVELRLPYTTLLAAPDAGACWLGNVGRNHQTGDQKNASWAPLVSGFHDKAAFAPFIFPVGVASPEADALRRGNMLGIIAAQSAEFRSLVKPLAQNRYDIRLLEVEDVAVGRCSVTADSRMLATLVNNQEKLLACVRTLRDQRQESLAQARLAALFHKP